MRFVLVVVVRFVDRCLYTWSVLDRSVWHVDKKTFKKAQSRRVVKREKSVAGVMLKEEKSKSDQPEPSSFFHWHRPCLAGVKQVRETNQGVEGILRPQNIECTYSTRLLLSKKDLKRGESIFPRREHCAFIIEDNKEQETK